MMKVSINETLNKFGLHITHAADPKFPHVQKHFVENAFDSFTLIASHFIQKAGLKTFVQLGANDGIHNDPLFPLITTYNLKGLLVEPQPESAGKLRSLYAGNENVEILEAAVSTSRGPVKLWRVAGVERAGKQKLDALATMDLQLLKDHLEILNAGHLPIECIEVKSLLLGQILEENDIKDPDIVVIDAEGMDKEILDQLPLTENGPGLILFEIAHMNSKDLEQCYKRLKDRNYQFVLTERDVICIHPKCHGHK